ncbi:MAG: autotransporter domain-containing protein [Pseudomonadota bacterium]|nr:autotransporter domain-containing protein [Pseudomonadota bacterium]
MLIARKTLLAAVAASMFGGIALEGHAANVDFLFVVDESGSMSGEQTFLQTFVPDLQSAFAMLATPLTTSFGLIGYGQSANSGNPRQHLVNGGDFGTAAQFVTAANNLEVSGGTEDGYEAILYGLNNVTFDPLSRRVVIIVTDEDRDNTDAAATLAAVQAALTAAGATMSGILNQGITSGISTTAIATDGTVSYIADGSGGFTTQAGYVFGAAGGATTTDYSDPAIANAGCVADLNLLRAGGATATSFAAAFLNCVQVVVQQQVVGGEVAILTHAHPVVSASLATVMGISNYQLSAIGHRIHALRQSASLPGIQVAGLDFIQNGYAMNEADRRDLGMPLGGGASADASGVIADNRLSGFISGRVEVGDFDQSAGITAFDYKVHGLTAGADYRLKDDVVVGASLSYHRTDSNLANNAGGVDIDNYGLALYASKMLPSDYYVDGTLTYTFGDMKTLRNVTGGQAKGSTNSGELALHVNAGRDFKMNDLTFGPFVGARYSETTVDAYNETGTLAVNVARQRVDGWTLEAGGRVSKDLSMNWGKLTLGGNLTLVHALDSNARTVSTSLASGTTLTSTVPGTDRTYFRLGLDAKGEVKKNTQVFARYDTLLDHAQSTAHSLQVGVRMAF